MFIYNVTTKINKKISEAWLQWLKEEHIVDIINTGCFTKTTILHLFELDDAESITYAVQYFAESKSLYNIYIEKYARIMRQKAFDKWGDKFISFRSVMQIIS